MKSRWTFCIFLIVAAHFLFTVVGCREQKKEQGVAENVAKTHGENVLALIGNEEVTIDDVETMLDRIPERRREALKHRVLDDVIEMRVFAKEARAKGLDKDTAILADTEKERKEVLAQNYISKRLDDEATPHEDALKTYYETHKGEFLVPESVKVQQIVTDNQAKAKEVLEALKRGENLQELANKVSVAHSRKGLEIEKWYYKGKMDPELEKTIFSLAKDTLGDIVKSGNSYYIFKVMEKKEPRHFTFDEARQKILSKLFWENKRKVIEKYYEAAGVNMHPNDGGKEPGVLAKIGDEIITEKSLEPLLSKADEKEREKIKMRWVEYFIETAVFSKEAEKVGLDKDPEVMRKLNLRIDRLLAAAFRAQHVDEGPKITDEEIKRYYDEHQETFKQPEKVRLKSIFVKTRQEAEEIMKSLKEGGESFGYIAQKKSLHPRANERAGEIGWFAKGQLDSALEAIAFSLKIDEMSDIHETKDGFQIIKVMDKKGGELQPLEEVAQAIKMNLIMQQFEKEKQQYYTDAGVRIIKQYEPK